jgi:hypothetical protein
MLSDVNKQFMLVILNVILLSVVMLSIVAPFGAGAIYLFPTIIYVLS